MSPNLRGRPRKWRSGFRTTCILIPRETEDVWVKARELADREMVTLSEVITRALANYVDVHYPGNPQTPLDSTQEAINSYQNDRIRARLNFILTNDYPNHRRFLEAVDYTISMFRRLSDPDPELKTLLGQVVEKAKS